MANNLKQQLGGRIARPLIRAGYFDMRLGEANLYTDYAVAIREIQVGSERKDGAG